jgi:hypothetical protein
VKRLFVCVCLIAVAGRAQARPDYRGEEKTHSTTHKGVKAVPVPPKYHVQNEGGSDGAGLCVPSSLIQNGQYQGVRMTRGGKDSPLWRYVKARPGGYSPDKLKRALEDVDPRQGYASYVGTNDRVLEKFTVDRNTPVGATMNTGGLYNYAPIHHMISLLHYSRKDGTACIMDNNDQVNRDKNGKLRAVYRWMPAEEFARRWIDGGTGWCHAWIEGTRKIVRESPYETAAAAGLLAAAVVAVIAKVKRDQSSESEPDRFSIEEY